MSNDVTQAKLKHDLAEIEKEIVTNSRMIDEYNAEHEALVLEDVECVLSFRNAALHLIVY